MCLAPRRLMRRLRRPNLLVLTLILALRICCAQNFRGSLVGTVKDSSGGRIPFATLIVEASASSSERHAECDGQGEFTLSDLPPGVYSVTARSSGFAPSDRHDASPYLESQQTHAERQQDGCLK